MNRILYSMLFLTCFSAQLWAQKTSVSPYSSFGYGDSRLNYGASSFGMGSVYSAYMSPYGSTANFMNPAANFNLSYTGFTFEGSQNASSFVQGNNRSKRSAGYISRISLAFPMGEKFTGGIGFQPFSSLGYNVALINEASQPKTFNKYVGNGGISSIHAYTSYKIMPEFAVGLRVNYLFGEANKDETFNTSETTLSTSYANHNEVYGVSFAVGAAYSKKLKNNRRLSLGLNYTPAINLQSKQEYMIQTYLVDALSGSKINKSIVYESNNNDADFKIPHNVGFGVSYGEDLKWNVAVQMDWEQMSQFKLENEKTQLNDRFRVAVGGFYIPKFNSYRSYFERATYRAGGFYEKTPISVNGQDVSKYGITFGLGLPVGRANDPSQLNIGVELGQQGTNQNNLIKESFANVKLSFTLNDTWFQKRKYD